MGNWEENIMAEKGFYADFIPLVPIMQLWL
jgi:hypothetical protein